MSGEVELSKTERMTIRLCEFINEHPSAKALQAGFLRHFGAMWVNAATHNLMNVYGTENLHEVDASRGVLLCSNHRSFFDMYVVSGVMFRMDLPWFDKIYFPVRSTFFYESWKGFFVNMVMGGGGMYPPIFRERAKQSLNNESLSTMIRLLTQPGTVIGMHPEGTRGKGDDCYQLLKAQPGVGRVALRSGATVLPIFVNGLGNDLPKQIASNFTKVKGDPISIVFGKPVDLSDFAAEKPRWTVDKRAADRIMEAISALGDLDRQYRSELMGLAS
jgi:1-acyl-sn-glycerol-3-phosphate acyltransferase